MKEAQEGSFWWVVIMYIQVVVLYVLSFIGLAYAAEEYTNLYR